MIPDFSIKSIDQHWGLYVHLPFCASKCPYCQFVSIVDGAGVIGRYMDALHRELSLYDISGFDSSPRTIYIGGGTPSLVPASSLAELLERLAGDETCEITVEANPESITEEWIETVYDAGVTRLSIGIQSLNDTVLATLGRIHTADRALNALEMVCSAGFKSISADIIFGVPGQTLVNIHDTLDKLTSVSHLSCYGLSIEEDTDYWKQVSSQMMSPPDPGLSADMYCLIDDVLRQRGFERYEISNFARPGHICLHNEAYWNLTPYLGFGLSAHSFDGIRRLWNTSDIQKYLSTIEAGAIPIEGMEEISGTDRVIETLMLALRTARGYDTANLNRLPSNITRQCHTMLDDWLQAGFIAEHEPGIICLTQHGALLADEIIAELAAIIG